MPFVTDPETFAQFVREAADCDRKTAELRAYKRRLKESAPSPHRQRELFSGLDCLPGQQDLFEVDAL